MKTTHPLPSVISEQEPLATPLYVNKHAFINKPADIRENDVNNFANKQELTSTEIQPTPNDTYSHLTNICVLPEGWYGYYKEVTTTTYIINIKTIPKDKLELVKEPSGEIVQSIEDPNQKENYYEEITELPETLEKPGLYKKVLIQVSDNMTLKFKDGLRVYKEYFDYNVLNPPKGAAPVGAPSEIAPTEGTP